MFGQLATVWKDLMLSSHTIATISAVAKVGVLQRPACHE